MLAGVRSNKLIRYDDPVGTILLGESEQQVLYQRRSKFKLGDLEYTLEAEQLTSEAYTTFKMLRDANKVEWPAPHHSISATPRPANQKLG